MARLDVLARYSDARSDFRTFKTVAQSWRRFIRQCHGGGDQRWIAFTLVPVDRRAHRFEIMTRCLVTDLSSSVSLRDTPIDITAAVRSVHVQNLLAAPPLQDWFGGGEQKFSRA